MDAPTVTAPDGDARSAGDEAADVERELLLQRTLFAGERSWVNDDLYSRISGGLVRRTRGELRLEPGASVDTNTYFGRFEASYWQRWTAVTDLTVRVAIETDGAVDVLVRASDIGSHVRTVDVARHPAVGRSAASACLRGTAVTDLAVRGPSEAAGAVDGLVRAPDIGSHVRTVDVARHSGDGMAVLGVPVDMFTDGGAMWLEFHAVDS